MAEDLKEIEIPLGEVRVFLRPKRPISVINSRRLFNFLKETFQEVKGASKPSVVMIPNVIEVIVVDADGKVEVF